MNDTHPAGPADVPPEHRVLLLGGTGRTGGEVLTQLLERGIPVTALVRSPDRLPATVRDHPRLQVVTAELATMPAATLAAHLRGCDTVVSCLGHNVNLKGVFGAPRDLVEQTVRKVHEAARIAPTPAGAVRLVLMSSVSVNRPDRADSRRGAGERGALRVLRALVPPARDNQRAADFLVGLGAENPTLGWVVVRPDTLRAGDLREYEVTTELVASLLRPASTRMAQVGHFMCALVTDDQVWRRWAGGMPVITDVGEPTS